MVDLSFSIYDLEYLLLIFVRVSCFVYIAPYFGMNDTPARIRIGISFFTAWLLYETLTPADAVVVDTVMEYAVIVMKEAIAGLLIGFGANICMAVVNFAGSIADMRQACPWLRYWIRLRKRPPALPVSCISILLC